MRTDTAAAPRGTGVGRCPARWPGFLLWLAALGLMLAAAVYQRSTGPTYPLRGDAVVAEETIRYALIRSEETTREARVEIPDPGAGVTGALVYRRYPADDVFQRRALVRQDGVLSASLPRQPAAGKLEYHLELETDAGRVRIPAAAEEDPVLRYKDPVPAIALVPHVLLMFLAMLVGVRAGLGAVAGRADTRRWAWTALLLMTVGGMVLGPIVQKYAFGAYWTGFPFGGDLTDNKTLVMWLAWIAACGALAWLPRAGRLAVVAATVVMLAVYLIPHSMRGSELDYHAVDHGIDPAEAVRTGR